MGSSSPSQHAARRIVWSSSPHRCMLIVDASECLSNHCDRPGHLTSAIEQLAETVIDVTVIWWGSFGPALLFGVVGSIVAAVIVALARPKT